MLDALNPPLATRRLTLEPLLGAHADELFPLLADPRTRRWIPPPKARTPAELCERWTALEGRRSPDGAEARLAWAVRADGRAVGKMDANVRDLVATNLGYVFGADFWGMGYASEAVGAVVDHLVASGIVELRATVAEGNVASRRVLERHGFTRQGTHEGELLYVRR
ncbi:MAG: GNAT family N-acetyltransferase [Myxococcota bacterium]